MKILEGQAAEALALEVLLRQVPAVALEDTKLTVEPLPPDRGIDFLARITAADRSYILVCEVKGSGQPRHVRTALLQLRNYAARIGSEAVPILIAPYLSAEAQALCREDGVGFLDFEGNARLVFGGVFIERLVASKPPAEQRGLKSLFKPKSAQVLRVMLCDPRHAWRVIDLAFGG